MLPKLATQKSDLPRRGRWSLVACSLALFALPTWFAAAQSQDAKLAPGDAGAIKKDQADQKPATPSAVTEPLLSRTPRGSPTLGETAAAVGQSGPFPIEFFPERSLKEQHIVRELDMPTTFDFTDESLDGVRETVMERHGFDILIEKTTLEEESVATDATDLTLKVSEVPLRSALRLLLSRKHLAYVIEDDVLKITTQTAYQTERLTRTYPVRDLAGDEAGDFLSLMEAIKQGVTPGAWKETTYMGGASPAYSAPAAAPPAGGTAKTANAPTCTISMVPASGSLVIHQTWQGHDEVLKLLRALRKAKSVSPSK